MIKMHNEVKLRINFYIIMKISVLTTCKGINTFDNCDINFNTYRIF